MKKAVEWYMDYKDFSEKELDILKTPYVSNQENSFDEVKYKQLIDMYFERMPFSSISSKDRYITFDVSGTAFIDKIFEDEVDEDTLVISTNYEHNSVTRWLNQVKNVLFLETRDLYDFSLEKIKLAITNYKKVFVYVIGTQLATGEITPQQFYVNLKELLLTKKIEHKMLIDDVHGMFFVPRDYSIFDYVLYTAHSIVIDFDMGLLISKDGRYGKKDYNWAAEYLKRLDIMLRRKDKIALFRNFILDQFNDVFSEASIFRKYTYCVSHIFAIETTNLTYSQEEWDKLDEYDIRVSEHPIMKNWIRIRFQEFCRLSPEKVYEGLQYLKKLLNRKIMLAKMKSE